MFAYLVTVAAQDVRQGAAKRIGLCITAVFNIAGAETWNKDFAKEAKVAIDQAQHIRQAIKFVSFQVDDPCVAGSWALRMDPGPPRTFSVKDHELGGEFAFDVHDDQGKVRALNHKDLSGLAAALEESLARELKRKREKIYKDVFNVSQSAKGVAKCPPILAKILAGAGTGSPEAFCAILELPVAPHVFLSKSQYRVEFDSTSGSKRVFLQGGGTCAANGPILRFEQALDESYLKSWKATGWVLAKYEPLFLNDAEEEPDPAKQPYTCRVLTRSQSRDAAIP